MTDFIPYFAGFVSLLFGVAFSYQITNGWNFKNDKKK